MDAIKRASFASKQIKAGPAPLASFEDLPSDELESPEDSSQVRIYASSTFEDEATSRDLQFTTPDSLTISSQSTPRIESDFDSHFTLTPGDPYQGQSSSELRTASLSSLSKEDSTSLCIKQKKGSAVSLGAYETTESEYNQRKSSWTDIFRSHNQNSAKSSSVISHQDLGEKVSKKKSKSDISKKDNTETKCKEKGKFLSIFKKKTNKNISSPISPDNFILSSDTLNITECLPDLTNDVITSKLNSDNIDTKLISSIAETKLNSSKSDSKLNSGKTETKLNSAVSKGKENESPKEIELCPTISEVQNDLGKINTERPDKIPDERKLNRKLINITEKSLEKEYNILSKQVEEKKYDKVSKTENIQAIVDVEDHESSESELVFEVKESVDEPKDDDFEAETLLPHDSSELEEEPVIELQPVSFEVSKQIVLPSRQQRLEITTKPIDRPRSTTPINVAPLEAFIQSVSPTFDSKVDKIKLSLPGEQFIGRLKSPKKSSMKSWADFCERGLHSPRMHKRIDKDDQKNPFDNLDGANSTHVPFSAASENWAVFESDFKSSESNTFIDDFSKKKISMDAILTTQQSEKSSEPYQPFETNFNFFPCSCECHMYGCGSCFESSTFESTKAQPNKQSKTSFECAGCACECHNKSSFSKVDLKDVAPSDSLKNYDISTVFGSDTNKEF